MSYPSLQNHLERLGIDPDTAKDEELESAFLAAFQEDLPLGFARVKELVAKLNEQPEAQRAMLTVPGNLPDAQQFTRLLAPDIPRRILEKHFGVAFGFYNCHKGIVGRKRGDLQLSLREQAEAQSPAFVDC